MPVRVSIIATVKNEESSVRRLLDSLAAQTRQPDELVFVDGGSADKTVEALQRYATESNLPLRVLVCPNTNISQGRNAAIAEARGDVIASTDAGVRLAPIWLEELVRPFEGGTREAGRAGFPPVNVVSGFFLPDPQSVFEAAMGATVLPALADIDPNRFLPSSRSIAFRKEAWQEAGGYPEWLDYCEDLIFDFKLRELYGPFPFAPGAIAYFRPRSGLKALFKQYYRYARGDGKADLWCKRHAIRYMTYLLVIPILLLLGFCRNPLWWLLLLAGAVVYLWTPYRRLGPMIASYDWMDKVKAILWVPIIRVVGDIAKMIGYPVGWLWRLKHKGEKEVGSRVRLPPGRESK
jgi:glycosyltransferase involved in cell wall biosynthesis